MNIKKFSLAIAITALIGLGGSELLARGYGYGHGDCGGPGYGHYHHMDFLQRELGLSNTQIEKIIRLDAEYRIKFHRNRNSSDKVSALRDQHRRDFEQILTKKQQNQFKRFRNVNRRGYHHGWDY